jgi:hypothetical protein
MTRARFARALVALTALASACGSSGATPDGGSDAPAGPALYGSVVVDLITDDHTAFLGLFYDGPKPVTEPMDVAQTQGDCRLVTPRAVSCTPACPSGQACTGTNQCMPSPEPVNVGVLHVTGLGDKDLDLEPAIPDMPSYQAVPTLPYPSCAEGGDVTASATGFTLAAKCVGALEVTSTIPIPVTSGQPMRLAWKAPGKAGISRVLIVLEISHHGNYKGQIECDVADTGTFDIPAPLVTALVALGRAGYPTVKVARTSVAKAPTQPNVNLAVSSRLELAVDTGVISCGGGDSPPCPANMTCQTDHTCR